MIRAALTYLSRYRTYRAGRSAPLWCTFAITENCYCRCQYCDFWHERKSDLTTAEVGLILRRLRDGGVEHMNFAGGEPLLRHDMPEIVRHATALGLRSSLTSSGTAGHESVFEQMMSAGLSSLTFSLDGATAEVHESFRKACAFGKVIRSIQTAAKARNQHDFSTLIGVTTVVHKQNCQNLEEICRLTRELGVDRNYFQPVWPIFDDPQFMEKYGFSGDDPMLPEVRDRLKRLPAANLREYFDLFPSFYGDYQQVRRTPCYAGRAFVHVDGRGNVLPCSMLDHPLGNLLHAELGDILERPDSVQACQECAEYKCPRCSLLCYIERNLIIDSLRSPLRSVRFYGRLRLDRRRRL
ncbi:MAG: radical SAM protein [Acidobacteria bacterium]|nr:radical SAM protein [Acidobacteriota bacterium]